MYQYLVDHYALILGGVVVLFYIVNWLIKDFWTLGE
jgi:hypothetical protein